MFFADFGRGRGFIVCCLLSLFDTFDGDVFGRLFGSYCVLLLRSSQIVKIRSRDALARHVPSCLHRKVQHLPSCTLQFALLTQ